MALLNPQERERLKDAVEQAEAATSGEFVTVIAAAADRYLYIPILWAALIALLVPAAFVVGDWPLSWAYSTQVLVFLALALIVQWPPLKLRLIPKAVKQRRAERLAREVFITRGLHLMPNRAGVLLFVSAGERYVEILADQGIASVVDDAQWQGIVDGFVDNVRAGRIGEGFVQAIEQCSTLMAEHFPPEPDQISLLPDHLIEIDSAPGP
jgi:putative membrane protein